MYWYELMGNNVWAKKLSHYMNDNFKKIIEEIKKTKNNTGLEIIPDSKNLFTAFKLTDLYEVKVVLIGQDPYHSIINNKKVAHGLAFSYDGDDTVPPSLKNIFKEIKDSIYLNKNLPDDFYDTNLTRWAKQGVFLFNPALTVLEKTPGCHIKIWEEFAQEVFKILNTQTGIIYLFLGNESLKYLNYIDEYKNHIIKAGHPSPLNTKIPFYGTGIFKKINDILIEKYGEPIIW